MDVAAAAAVAAAAMERTRARAAATAQRCGAARVKARAHPLAQYRVQHFFRSLRSHSRWYPSLLDISRDIPHYLLSIEISFHYWIEIEIFLTT